MSDPRQFVGVRLSPAGVGYAKHVAQRDHVTFSEAIRRLLSLGARADKDTHDRTRPAAHESARRSPHPDHVRADDSDHRDRHGDGSSRPVPDVPPTSEPAEHPTAADTPSSDPDTPGSIGDAIAVLHYAGLAPAPVNDEPRSA